MYVYSDGGREEAGFKSKSDCGIRAFAIALDLSYNDSRKALKKAAKAVVRGSGAIANGIYKEDMAAALAEFGWVWHSAPKFEGRKARYYDIPGKAILQMAGHYAAVVDGVLYDSWDSSNKMVYGYWAKKV